MKIIDTQALGALEDCIEGPGMGWIYLFTLLHGYGYYFILNLVSSLRMKSGLCNGKRGALDHSAMGTRDVAVKLDA